MTVFAQRMKTMEKSAAIIRGLFGAMNDPGIISFGGGAPAREALPIDIVREITNEVITRDGRGVEALQYGNVMGLPDLRDIVVSELLAPKGVEADAAKDWYTRIKSRPAFRPLLNDRVRGVAPASHYADLDF